MPRPTTIHGCKPSKVFIELPIWMLLVSNRFLALRQAVINRKLTRQIFSATPRAFLFLTAGSNPRRTQFFRYFILHFNAKHSDHDLNLAFHSAATTFFPSSVRLPKNPISDSKTLYPADNFGQFEPSYFTD